MSTGLVDQLREVVPRIVGGKEENIEVVVEEVDT